jgi:hypothetical protein
MQTENIIRAKIFGLKKHIDSILWGENFVQVETVCAEKNGPNKKMKMKQYARNIDPKNLVAHEEAACYVRFSRPRLIL